jgi:hypothetical protein
MNSMNKRWLNRAAGVLCIGLVSLVMAACGGDLIAGNAVVATVDPAEPISATVGESRAVRVTFTTDDGRPAAGLSITSGLSPLPAGWTSTSSSLSCGTVAIGSTCQLDLSYAPTAATPSANLTLGYSYTDASGAVKSADVNIAYSSTAAPASNTVLATVDPAGPINVVVGQSRGVRLAFTTNDGNAATNLNITSGLSPLPAGWTSASPSLSCSTVTTTGSGCQLDLSYAPAAATSSANLTLGYSYTDASGAVKSADVNIAYSSTVAPAVNTVLATVDPAGPISVAVGQSRAVRLTFTTDDGNAATNLSITSGLSALPAGWTSASPSLSCSTVTTGSTCQLDLSYAPAAVTPSTNLTLGYSYVDSSGAVRTAGANITYSSALAPTVYIANALSNTVTRCTIVAGGLLSDCRDAGATGFSNLLSIAIKGSTAYLASYGATAGSGQVVRCAISTDDGSLSNCTNAGVSGSSSPKGVDVNGSFLYVSDASDNVFRCDIAADTGALSGCVNSGAAALASPENTLISGSWAYVVGQNNRITRCAHDATTGQLSACNVDTTVSGLNSPAGGAIKGSTLYIVNNGAYNVIQCTISASDGSLSQCGDAGGVSGVPGLVQIAIDGSTAYLLNGGTHSVTRCTIDATTGSLTLCANANATGLSMPQGIAIK